MDAVSLELQRSANNTNTKHRSPLVAAEAEILSSSVRQAYLHCEVSFTGVRLPRHSFILLI